MKIFAQIMGWFFSLLFVFFLISMVLLQNVQAALILILLILLCLPPLSAVLRKRIQIRFFPFLKFIAILLLMFVFIRVLTGGTATSIYTSPQVKAQFEKIYDEKMRTWPIPYEDIFLDSAYGPIHVIASGPKDSTALLLLHASGVAGWSWKYNVQALSQNYRTFAIDLIGDAGKSEFRTLEHIMHTGKDQADLYADLCDQLGIETAFVVGASEGGFVGSNLAMYYPERVKKLVLLGPMGYSGATQAIMRITFAQLFPIQSVQKATFNWAFSSAVKLQEDFGEWFILLMSKTQPVKVAPMPFTTEQRQSISVPVMFVFGERDNLVGDPQAAKTLVQDMQDVRVNIVDAGHLMAGEVPEQVNTFILDFFEE